MQLEKGSYLPNYSFSLQTKFVVIVVVVVVVCFYVLVAYSTMSMPIIGQSE